VKTTTDFNAMRHARVQCGLSQEKLAQELGVSSRTVVRWEAGTSTPHPNTQDRMAVIFGLEPSASRL